MKRLLLIAAVLGLATAGPAAAGSFKGVVVAKTHGGVLVARSTGAVSAVHAHARVGSRVSVSGSHLRVLGRAHSARVHGVVVSRTRGTMVLSAAHRLFAVRTGRHLADVAPPGTTTTSTTTTPPAPGAVVTSTVAITPQGDLDEQETEDVGQAGSAQVQALVTAVGPGTVTVTVNGQSLVIPLPAGLTLPATVVGTQVTLTLSFANGQTTANDDDQGDDDNGDNNASTTTPATTTAATTTTTTSSSDHHGHDGGDGGGHG